VNYKKIILIGGVLLPACGFCNPRIDDFQNLLSLVCTDSNFSAASQLQMEVAKQRMESSQTDTWMPELTVGLDVYKAEGQPTSFLLFKTALCRIQKNLTFSNEAKAG
jgi:hypothetical protein